MNEIQRLIQEMCPDGVPMVALGEVCEIKNGKDYKNLSSGNIPVWGTGGIMTYVNQYAYNGPSVLLPRKGSIEKVYYSEGPIWTVDTLFYTIIDQSKILPKYLYVFISMQDLRALDTSKGNRPSLTQTVLNKIQIPLPPLPIQQRIVEILDKFTSLVSSLDSEIALRQKQYEFYRNKLLTFEEGEEGVEWKKLGDVGKMIRGNGLQKSDFRESGFPCIHYGQIHTYYGTSTLVTKSFCDFEFAKKLKKAASGDLLIATTSEDVEACCKAVAWLGKGEVAYSGDSYCFSHNQNPKYMSYLFQTEMFAKQKRRVATGAKVVRVSGDAMEKFVFPFPSLEKQQSIVESLDTFESLLTNLKKERALRQKQYEYYREKLLTFA